MNNFDWKEYQETEEEIFPQEENNDSFEWEKYQEEDETSFESGLRNIARSGSRILETIGGFPGDIREFGNSLIDSLGVSFANDIRALTGKKRLTKEQKDEIREKIEKEKSYLQQGLDLLPTSEQLKDFSSKITSGFTDPQNAEEEFADDIISLGTSIFMGSKDPVKYRKFLKSLGLAAGAKGAGKTAELYGSPKSTQAAVEGGSLLLWSLLSKRLMYQMNAEKYNRALSAIPQGTMLNTNNLQQNLTSYKTKLNKGLPKTNPVKSEIISSIEELESKIAGGAISVDDLVESYRDINRKMSSKGLLDQLNKNQKGDLKKYYNELKKNIDIELAGYGNTNPDFYNEWKDANQAHAILKQSESSKDFILKNIHTLPGHLALGTAIKLFMGLPLLASAGAAYAAYQTGRILNRMVSNKTLRRYYLDIVKSAKLENVPSLIKSMSKFDKEYEKEKEANPQKNTQ